MPRGGRKPAKKKQKKGGGSRRTASSADDSKKTGEDSSSATAAAADTPAEEDAAELLMKKNKRRWEVDQDAAHAFWDTQPVPTMKEEVLTEINEAIDNKTVADIRKEPLTLPGAFQWVSMDLTRDEELSELYELLKNHYVEDDDAMFRFEYSPEFLRWALCIPHYNPDLHIGIRHVASGTLMAFISGVPAICRVKTADFPVVEINFLCVHEKLRGKRLAPVLIKEVTRRVNLTDVWQAVFTAGVTIPKPIASTRYWHRSLNPPKLMDIGFSSSRRRVSRLSLKKLYTMPESTTIPGLRPMVKKDCEQAWKLLMKYLDKFPFHLRFTLEEFEHLFMPRKGVVYSYVVCGPPSKSAEDDPPSPLDTTIESKIEETKEELENMDLSTAAAESGSVDASDMPALMSAAEARETTDCPSESDDYVVTDLISFYNLPSQVMKHPKYSEMRAAYSFYNVPGQYSLKELVTNALILAQREKFDLYNCLDLMDNHEFLQDKSMKFGIGDGHLQYYVYNWRTAEIEPREIAVVLV